MDGFEHTDNPLRPRGSKTTVETIEQSPEAWSGEGVARRGPEDIDATFAHFEPEMCLTDSLAEIDFGEFLLPPEPAYDEDDIEALAEAALSGQTHLFNEFNHTTLDGYEPLLPPTVEFLTPVVVGHAGLAAPSTEEEQVENLPFHGPSGDEAVATVDAPEADNADLDCLLKAYDPPSGTVEPLPAVVESETVTVRWKGRASNGAPVAYFDVFVSVDDGPFEMWQESTSATEAEFTGTFGQRYAFFVIATDQAGNRQTLPEGPQATVHLQAPAPVVEQVEPEPQPDVVVEPELPRRAAPVLDAALLQPLPPVEMNTLAPAGHRVADVLGSAVVACEPGHSCGIAVVAQSGIADGQWTYSLDRGLTWQPFPPVFHGAALLLGPEDRVRFLPRHLFVGAVGLTFRAWDQSSGASGQLVALVKQSTTGGDTAFSARLGNSTLPVVAGQPVLTPSYRTEAALPLVTGGARGSMVARFPGAAAGAQPRGIAVVSLSGDVDGHWQYSRDGGRTWRNFGSVYRGRARLLRAEDRVRFLPHGGYRGPARLIYHVWDQQNPRDTANVLPKSAVGDGTPYSAATQATLWAV